MILCLYISSFTNINFFLLGQTHFFFFASKLLSPQKTMTISIMSLMTTEKHPQTWSHWQCHSYSASLLESTQKSCAVLSCYLELQYSNILLQQLYLSDSIHISRSNFFFTTIQFEPTSPVGGAIYMYIYI